jgi:hypothetical protein
MTYPEDQIDAERIADTALHTVPCVVKSKLEVCSIYLQWPIRQFFRQTHTGHIARGFMLTL